MKYCAQCGVQLLSGSRFCGSCGNPVDQNDDRGPLNIDGTITNEARPWRLLEILFLLGCVGAFAGVLIPLVSYFTNADANIDSGMIARGIFTFGICMYLLGRWRDWSRSWVHALAGSLFLLLVASIAIGTARIRQEEQRHAPISKLLASLKKFDPQLAERLQKTNPQRQETARTLLETFHKAVRKAPDDAVIRFNQARLHVFTADFSEAWCRTAAYQEVALILNEGWQDADDIHLSPPSLNLSTSSQEMLMIAMSNLFDAAAGNAEKVDVKGLNEIAPLMKQLKAKIDPLDLLADTDTLKKLSPVEICNLHKSLMKSINALPNKEAASIYRYMSSFD